MTDTEKKSPNIVTEGDLKEVLENKKFDSVKFLRLYNDWRISKDQAIFAKLRTMHEEAGYNNKNIIGGSEQEMDEIASIVQRFEDKKRVIIQQATTSGKDIVTQNVTIHVGETAVVPAQSPNHTEVTAVPDTAISKPLDTIQKPYPDKQNAFKEALMVATSFPFNVKYTEGGKSYEVNVISSGNTITIGEKLFRLHDFAIAPTQITLETNSIVINGNTRIEKRVFQEHLSTLLGKGNGTYDVGSGLASGKITISGELNPKAIETPKVSVDKSLLEKIKTLQTELEKRMREGLTPVELAEGLKYISDNVKDEPTKQMAINYLMNKLSREYTILFEKDGSLNVISKDTKNTQTAATYQNALQSSLSANHISRGNIQESMTMLTGQRWSNYARTIADPKAASAQGYAKYLADTYGLDIEKKTVSQIQNHQTMTTEDKAWLLSYLNGQMSSLDVEMVTKNYQENLKSYQTLIDSPFFAILNKATGGAPLTPEQAQSAVESAARGSNEGGGKTSTWTLGILGAIIGLGFKKGEGWSLWTSLKRMFMGGLAVGGVMLGCSAGREWKKELGMDVCDEAKKALKDAWKDMKGETTDATTPAGAAGAPAGQAQGPATGPTTLSQQAAENDKTGVKADTRLLALIDAKKTHPTTNGTIDHYIAFARTLKDTPLQTLVAPNNNPQMGIFGDSGLDPAISNNIPANLDKTLLKDFLRRYLTGQSIRTSALKPAGASWDDYKSKFDISKTLGDEIQKTYIQNAPAQSNNTGAATVDENTLKSYTVTGASIDSSKTNVVKNPDGTFILSYSLSNLGIFVPDGPLSINLDKTGTVTSPTIKLRGKAGPLGTTEKLITVSKNNSTINLQIG